MQLIVQLGSAALLAVLTSLIHGAGVATISHLLGLDRPLVRTRRFHVRTVATLGAVGLLLFALHLIEIALFAGFFRAAGGAGSIEQALYVSASAYSTLGSPDQLLPLEWRVLGAVEGLIGFLMLGWSTAFFVTDMNKLLRQ